MRCVRRGSRCLLVPPLSYADGAQRIAAARERDADAREREVRGDDEARFDRPVDSDAAETRERSGERPTERER